MTPEARKLAEMVLLRLGSDFEAASRSQQLSLEDTKQAGSAMTSRYDTFREEAEYRTTAYGLQRQQIQTSINMIKSLLVANPETGKKAVAGSLVTVRMTTETKTYLILPSGGGMELELNGKVFSTINMQAPLAKSILKTEAGDEVELVKASCSEPGTIIEVM